MSNNLKIHINPKFEIGSTVWALKFGVCGADYYMNPTDEKFMTKIVVGYNINHKDSETKITSYEFDIGQPDSGLHDWIFKSKKEIKDHYKKLMIKAFLYGNMTVKPNVQQLELTESEKEQLGLI